MRQEFKALIEGYKEEAKGDTIGLYQIISRMKKDFHAQKETEIRDLTLEFVREMLANGFEAIDPPYLRNGYHRWENQDPDYVINRIKTEWQALGRIPNIPDIVWFGRTEWKLGLTG